MDVCTLNNHYLHPLSNNLSKKANKTLFLLCNFSMDLLKFDTPEHVSTFMDAQVYNHLQPYIYLPTRISYKSTTLKICFVMYQPLWSKLKCLEKFNQVYQIIFSNSLYYQISFQIFLQLLVTLHYMIWKTLITSHLLRILKI